MLLKIFIPIALLILPILLPINAVGGRNDEFAVGIWSNGDDWHNVTGLDQLSWVNIRPDKNHRYWAHLVLAEIVVGYCCYVFFDEMRGFIRLRQAYLTSPQHRLRASATTVLVTSIPRKWCTVEALEGLYDVFPGGIRNIWVNRNFDELNDKVQLRNKLARILESAETNLIKKCKKVQLKRAAKAAKASREKRTKEEKAADRKAQDDKAEAFAETQGVSAGNLHQVHHTVNEELYGSESSSKSSSRHPSPDRGEKSPLDLVGQGVGAVGKGVANIGKTIFGGIKNVGKDVDAVLNTTQGLQIDGAESSSSGTNGAAVGKTEAGPSRSREKSPEASNTSDSAIRKDATPPPESKRVSSEVSDRKNRFEGSSSDHDGLVTNSPDTRVEEQRPQTSETHDFAEQPVPKPQPNAPKEPRMTPLNPRNNFHFWRQDRNVLQVPSPMPHGANGDEFPLQPVSQSAKDENKEGTQENGNVLQKALTHTTTGSITKREDYPPAFDEAYDPNADDPVWKQYLQDKDRETIRIPYKGLWSLSWLPFFGRQVDTIDFCRREVARLNLEIERDQKEPEKFPHMNSAFIQFNHQVAAHLACQAVSHHIPNQMAPRVIEIAPDDVIWDNMSVKWWERYLRTAVVLVVIAALIIGWAIPVAFTGLLSQVSGLAQAFPKELGWMERIPASAISLIQGLLPPLLLAILLAVLPLILRLLARAQGIVTGMLIELALADYYFFFLFVQVFLVVTLASGITQVWSQLSQNVASVPNILAGNLPKASNYFFSYLVLQAMSTSASALLQVLPLLLWFVWAAMVDSTPREKWARQVNLRTVDWGTFFPFYTVFAVIGMCPRLNLAWAHETNINL